MIWRRGEVGLGNPKNRMGSLAVGHRERVEIKPLSLGPLPEQFPIVTTGVDRRYQTPGHGRMECLRSQQSSKRLVRKNQSRAQLEHFTWTEPSRCAHDWFRSIIQNGIGAELLPLICWDESKQFALFAPVRANAFIVVE